MNTLARRSAPAFVLAFLAACLFVRLASFGIWDPWELERADSARALLGGEGPKGFVGLSTWAVAMGFRQFDVHEWSGRMPIALFGPLTILTAYAIGRRVSDARGALYTAVVAATSPLFLLNARQMLGVAPSFFAQALFGFALVSLVRTLVAPDRSTTRRDLAVWSLFAMATGALAAFAAGVLQGVLAPLVAAAIVPPLFGRASGGDSARTMVYGALALAAAGLTAGTVNAILHPESASALWIGGSPVSGTPPTFEIALERIFHGFAPWSALLPAAIAVTIGAGMWTPDPDAAPASPVDAETDAGRTDARLYLVLWAAFGYAALTYFSSHYGNTTYLPVVALAALVASFLRDVERSDSEWWVAGIVSALLAALIIRDFDLYPSSPLGGLTVGEVEVPDVFHPNMIWAALLGAFAVVTGLVFGIAPIPTRLDLRAP
ncbi:MAG: glycosyltransferase family 39 protein, partial [Myxococcales bacterium]|nr:glycosyltransferase family 39 protein [Myxococcales bacterium]